MRVCAVCVFVLVACGPIASQSSDEPIDAITPELRKTTDAAVRDAGAVDAGRADAGHVDAGVHDAGVTAPVIFTVVFENHDYAEVVGSIDAPYFNELIAKYGLATNYNDCNVHPSLPNYLCMISGAPQFGGGSDPLPTKAPFPVSAQHLGSQMLAANIPFRSYQESMGTACRLSNSGKYAPKHDPFLYFADIQQGVNNLCADTNVDSSQFAADLQANRNRYYFITPNLANDGHDPLLDPRGALRQSDAWARAEISKILQSDAYRNGGILFITWDEGEGRNGDSKDQVPMIIVSEKIVSAGYRSSTAYSHLSYLATVEDLLGLPRLPTVSMTPAMGEFIRR